MRGDTQGRFCYINYLINQIRHCGFLRDRGCGDEEAKVTEIFEGQDTQGLGEETILCEEIRYGFLILSLLTGGCASLNFSSKYYVLPMDYQEEVGVIWTEALWYVPLKYRAYYTYKITKDKETKPAGIPQTKDRVIYIPEYFLQYVYEFYYPRDYKAIIGCVILHEIAHTESGLPDNPIDKHYLVDLYTINNLIPVSHWNNDQYYSALVVVNNYWSARKGAGGHAFNVGWNVVNAVSALTLGVGSVGDLYGTDINKRLGMMKSDFPLMKFIFKRNKN